MAGSPDEQPKIVLFLGAGASVGAGVPTTISFVDEFLSDVKPEKSLDNIVKELRQANKNSDVEELLSVLHALSDSGVKPLRLFLSRREDLPKPEEFQQWTESLESYIRKRCFVRPEGVSYFEPLRRILANYRRPLDVFTVNYDTVIEVFCWSRGIEFNNGFRGAWQPSSLEDKGGDLRLHKIHGSVTWWETDQGSIVEIPVVIEKPETQLYYGAKARTLVIYPDPVKAVSRPILDMLPLLRRRLGEADLFVSVGYSFRDDQIRDLVLEAARARKGLLLVLIGPNAHGTYSDRLAQIEQGVSSSVVMRTACLPFAFEKVFPSLQEDHLKHALSGLQRLQKLQADEVRYSGGVQPHDWAYACEELARGGLFEAALYVLNHSNPSGWRFEQHFHSVVIAYAFAAWSKAAECEKGLEPHVGSVATRIQNCSRVGGGGGRFVLEFDLSPPGAREAPAMVQRMRDLLMDLAGFLEHLADMCKDPKKAFADFPNVAKLHKGIVEAAKHLADNWLTERLPMTNHLYRWQPYLPALGLMKSVPELAKELESALVPDELKSAFSTAEGKTLRRIFKQEDS